MSSVTHTYTKSKQTSEARLQELAAKNKRLGIFLGLIIAALASSVFIFRGGNF